MRMGTQLTSHISVATRAHGQASQDSQRRRDTAPLGSHRPGRVPHPRPCVGAPCWLRPGSHCNSLPLTFPSARPRAGHAHWRCRRARHARAHTGRARREVRRPELRARDAHVARQDADRVKNAAQARRACARPPRARRRERRPLLPLRRRRLGACGRAHEQCLTCAQRARALPLAMRSKRACWRCSPHQPLAAARRAAARRAERSTR